ncbi:FliM/FliN family flagellar motor switch protein [Methylocystis echinoides]|jgi:flagellar motor switch protein FliM|uniref:FliM/FliN family flagellar motor switch protein n=1 Tax=Methylocystis echinoides TaxID=29468 RepID=UPI003426AA54
MILKEAFKEGGEELVLVGDATIDRMPALTAIFEETGANFARFLSRYANGIVVTTENFEGSRVHELAEKYGALGKIYVFRSQENDTRLAVAVDGVFRCLTFELLLGSGVIDATLDRPPTRIEDRIIAYCVTKLVSGFADAFSSLSRLTYDREPSLEGSGFFALGSKATVAALVRMTIRYGDYAGQILVALPRSALDPFRDALSRTPGAEGKATDEKWSENLYQNLVRTEVRAEVRLEARGFTLGDISRLEVGDVLRLPIAPTDPIRVVAEGRTLFWCTLGQKDNMYTVRLEEFSDERESYIENILGV